MQIENLINKSTDTKNTDTKTINDMTAGMRVSDYIKTDSSDNMSKKAAVVGSSNSVDMSDTIYARPQAKNEAGNNDGTDMAENLLNDMNQTSENRRNDMIVTASTTTSDDYKAAKDDGYDVIVTETDKIKAVLAKAGVDISIYGDDLSMEQLTDITGSQTEAAMLVNQMKAYDIPATDDNIKAGTDAIDRAKSLTNISNETKAYLVRNNMNPTVSNVYKATYSSSQVQDYRQKTKMTEISDELFEELKPQLKQILEEAHIDSSDENLNQCRWLIDEDIAVTPDNVLLANQVDCINAAEENVSSDFYARAVTEALAMGKKATDATMSQDGLTFDIRPASVCTSPEIFHHCPTTIATLYKACKDIFICFQVNIPMLLCQQFLYLIPQLTVYNRFMRIFNSYPVFFLNWSLFASHTLMFLPLYHVADIHFIFQHDIYC